MCADLAAFTDLDRPQNLRTGPNDNAGLECRMALAADPARGVGPAQRHILVDGDLVADLGWPVEEREERSKGAVTVGGNSIPADGVIV